VNFGDEMKVHALLNLYNDRTFLSAMLESIREHVDSIIVADGAYQVYYDTFLELHPDAKPWSTDGSLEIIEAFPELPPVTMIGCPDDKPWLNQAVKRTALLDAVPNGDWLIIIDADEMLIGDVDGGMFDIYKSGCVVAGTPYYNPGLDAAALRMRWHPWIYKKQEGMHYHMTHWYLSDRHGRIFEERYPVHWTDKFVWVHFKAFKQLKRTVSHQDYMKLLSPQGWLEPTKMKVEQ